MLWISYSTILLICLALYGFWVICARMSVFRNFKFFKNQLVHKFVGYRRQIFKSSFLLNIVQIAAATCMWWIHVLMSRERSTTVATAMLGRRRLRVNAVLVLWNPLIRVIKSCYSYWIGMKIFTLLMQIQAIVVTECCQFNCK